MAYDTTITKFSTDMAAIRTPSGTMGTEMKPPTSRYGGRRRTICGNFEVAVTDIDDDDIIVLARIPSHAVVHSIKICGDALDSHGTETLTCNVGIYKPDGTVVDEDCYASALATIFQDAVLPASAVDVRYEAATTAADPAKVGQAVWQDGGESADPAEMRDIAITIAADAETQAAGTIGYQIEYSLD